MWTLMLHSTASELDCTKQICQISILQLIYIPKGLGLRFNFFVLNFAKSAWADLILSIAKKNPKYRIEVVTTKTPY